MAPPMRPNSSKTGSASKNTPVKSGCTFRCSGYLLTPPGWIKSKSGSVCESRKHLQPNHFPSTQALENSLNEFIAYYNQTSKPINWTYTVEKLEQKIGKLL